jgi:hypothetical protein
MELTCPSHLWAVVATVNSDVQAGGVDIEFEPESSISPSVDALSGSLVQVCVCVCVCVCLCPSVY